MLYGVVEVSKILCVNISIIQFCQLNVVKGRICFAISLPLVLYVSLILLFNSFVTLCHLNYAHQMIFKVLNRFNVYVLELIYILDRS